jgi:hypothetical protein
MTSKGLNQIKKHITFCNENNIHDNSLSEHGIYWTSIISFTTYQECGIAIYQRHKDVVVFGYMKVDINYKLMNIII